MLIHIFLAVLIGWPAGILVNLLADYLPARRKAQWAAAEGRETPIITWQPKYSDGTPRPIIAWSGILAFVTGKRLAPTGGKLSWRHPITELLTMLFMGLALGAAAQGNDVSAIQTIFWLAYMVIFMLVIVIDIEHKLILFTVIIPSALLALVDALITPNNRPPNLGDALIGGIMGFVVFWLLYNGGFLFTYIMGKLRGQEINTVAFGYGDVMMAMLSGLILGWRALIFAMFFTVFLGALGAMLYLVGRRLLGQRYSAFTALPYGPYIVVGTMVMLLYPDTIRVLLGWN